MNIRIILFSGILGMLAIKSIDAARASCEFEPMEGIDSKYY